MSASMKFFENATCMVPCPGWSMGAFYFVMLLLASMHVAAEGSGHGRVQVSATVLTVVNMKIVRQPGQLNIEQRHLNQGYVDIEVGSELSIRSNNPNGFTLTWSTDLVDVSRVSARISQSGVDSAIGDGCRVVRTPRFRVESVHVSYRLHLNSQAQTGTHPWPIALSFTPNTV